jgi:putative spermidine/putrescine transport system permease protein
MKPTIGVRLVSGLIGLLLVFPTIVLVGTSFNANPLILFPPTDWSTEWYAKVLSDSRWLASIWNSFQVAIVAAVLAMLVGSLMAFAAVRGKLLPESLLTVLAMLPIIVPTVVAGLGFYIVSANIHLTSNIVVLGLAHATLGIPLVFVNVLAALTTIDPRIEEASRVCGANELVTALRVTLPLIVPATVVGGVLAFITSWDEVIVANFLTSPTFKTVPVIIYGNLREGATPATSAVATMTTLTSLVLLAVVAVFAAVRRGRAGRNVE